MLKKYGKPTNPQVWSYFAPILGILAFVAICGNIISGLTEAVAVYDPQSILGPTGAIIVSILVAVLIEGSMRVFAPMFFESFFDMLRGFKIAYAIIFVISGLLLIAVFWVSKKTSLTGKTNIIHQQLPPPDSLKPNNAVAQTMRSEAFNQFAGDSLEIVARLAEEKQAYKAELNRSIENSRMVIKDYKSRNDYTPESQFYANRIKTQSNNIATQKKRKTKANTTFKNRLENELNQARSKRQIALAKAHAKEFDLQGETAAANAKRFKKHELVVSQWNSTGNWIVYVGIFSVLVYNLFKYLGCFLSGRTPEIYENEVDNATPLWGKFREGIKVKSYGGVNSVLDGLGLGNVELTDTGLTVNIQNEQEAPSSTTQPVQQQRPMGFNRYNEEPEGNKNPIAKMEHTSSYSPPTPAIKTAKKTTQKIVPQHFTSIGFSVEAPSKVKERRSFFDYDRAKKNLVSNYKRLYKGAIGETRNKPGTAKGRFNKVSEMIADFALQGYKCSISNNEITVESLTQPSLKKNNRVKVHYGNEVNRYPIYIEYL